MLDLIDDCIACAVDKLIADFGGFVWDEAGFEKLRDFVRENLNEVTVDIAQKVEQILSQSRLKPTFKRQNGFHHGLCLF